MSRENTEFMNLPLSLANLRSKIMAKCAGLGCSVYDYLKMILETDINEPMEVKRTEKQEDSTSDSEIDERIRRIRERLEAIPS